VQRRRDHRIHRRHAAPIPDHEIDSIRQLVESDLAYDPCPLIHEGDQVEVTHGPLKASSDG
jgi:transcription antitermination factor NusG